MYSVVLMMAVTGGAEAPDFGRRCNSCSSCHGCSGVVVSCHGCHGCSSCHGCNSCHGRRGLFGRHRCNSCNTCHSCHSVCSGFCNGGVILNGGCSGTCGGTVIIPTDPGTGPGPDPKTKEKDKKPVGSVVRPATILVTLPADAKLTIDGNSTTQASDRRTFTTPALDVNSEYVYNLRAEVVREGRTVVETQTVTVRGGLTTTVPFSFSTSVASR